MFILPTKKQVKENELRDIFESWSYIDYEKCQFACVLKDNAPQEIINVYNEWLVLKEQPDPDEQSDFFRSIGFFC